MQRLLLLVALSTTALAPIASAQDRVRARQVFEEADRHFHAGNHQLALEGFQESQRMMAGDPRTQTLIEFNIARCHEELGDVEAALASFERYLRDATGDSPQVAETHDRVRDLRARLAARPARSPALAIAGWSLGGLGVAGLVASIPLGILSLDRESTLNERCPTGRCGADQQGLLDEARALSIATDALWIAGLGLAAVGAALILVDALTGSDDVASVAAACGPSGCLALIEGRL